MSAAIGFAAALATLDDVGRRELLGLATASQFVPAVAAIGAGVATRTISVETLRDRAKSVGLNTVTLLIFAAITYAIVDLVRRTRPRK